MTLPLPVLATIVVLGLSLVALVQWWLGWGARLTLDPDEARARLLLDLPDAEAGRTLVGTDGRAALVQTDTGFYLVGVVGDGHFTRRVQAWSSQPDGLRLELRDPGAPALTLLTDPSSRGLWLEALDGA